eukprot:scaffold247000_cov13-Tisochrysis_lutea.AAC.1
MGGKAKQSVKSAAAAAAAGAAPFHPRFFRLLLKQYFMNIQNGMAVQQTGMSRNREIWRRPVLPPPPP